MSALLLVKLALAALDRSDVASARAALEGAIALPVAPAATHERPTPRAEYLTRGMLAERLAVSVRHVDGLVRGGQIPSLKLGRARRFDLDAVRAALGTATTSPAEATEPADPVAAEGAEYARRAARLRVVSPGKR